MAKVTEYSRITKLKDNDIFLVDGPDGTRTILQTDAAKQMGGEVVMVNETAGDSTKVVINTTDEEIQLATMDDLKPVADDTEKIKEETTLPYSEIYWAVSDRDKYVRSSDGTIQSSSSGLYATSFVDVSEYTTIRYRRTKTTTASPNTGMAFYNSEKAYITGVASLGGQTENGYADGLYEVEVPEGAKYARFTAQGDTDTYGDFDLLGLKPLKSIASDIAALADKQDATAALVAPTNYAELVWDSGQVRYDNGVIRAAGAQEHTQYVNIGSLSRIKYSRLCITSTSTVSGMAFYDEDFAYLSGQQSLTGAAETDYVLTDLDVPEGAVYARFTRSIALTNAGKDFALYDAEEYDDSLIGWVETVEAKSALIGSPTLYLAETPTDPDFNYATAADGGTTYADIYERYDALCTAYPRWLKRGENIGSDSENYPIAHYTLRMYDPVVDSGANYSDWDGTGDPPTNLWRSNTVYRHVLLTAGVHGPEKAGVLALYYLTKEIITSSDEWARYLRSNAIIEIIPIICPGNFNANRRNNVNDVNVNRDYFAKASAEAQAMTTYIESIRADLHCALDFHTAHGRMGFVAVPPTNPKVNLLMTMANQTFAACVDNWESVTTALGIPDTFYPYAYANLSANAGTLSDYIRGSGITNYACTVETPTGISTNSYTTEKAIAASKMSMDIGCNLLQRILAI